MTGKFIDMFAGMGTIRMGFEKAGWECVSAIEFDPHKRKIYEVIFGHEPEFSDITAVRGPDLPYADCWCFGAPCQDFSVAGLRAGLDGERSGLVREVFRLVREKAPADRPEWLLYENVKGMLSSNSGWDFAAIQAEMGQCGYDVEWCLLNSKDFGVPQNRERVYTLGHLRARGSRKVFPIGADNKNLTVPIGTNETSMYADCGVGHKWEIRKNITPPLRSQPGGNPPGICVKQLGNVMPTATRENPNQGRVYDPTGLAPCLNKMEGGGREPLIASGIYTNVSPKYNRGPLPGLSRTLKADGNHPAGVMIPEPCACLTPDRIEKRQNGRRFKKPNEPMFTLTKQDIHGVTNGTRIRRLTPRECMRLQGVDDAVTDKLIAAGISDTQLYRAVGDACTVNVIYEIARRLGQQFSPNHIAASGGKGENDG